MSQIRGSAQGLEYHPTLSGTCLILSGSYLMLSGSYLILSWSYPILSWSCLDLVLILSYPVWILSGLDPTVSYPVLILSCLYPILSWSYLVLILSCLDPILSWSYPVLILSCLDLVLILSYPVLILSWSCLDPILSCLDLYPILYLSYRIISHASYLVHLIVFPSVPSPSSFLLPPSALFFVSLNNLHHTAHLKQPTSYSLYLLPWSPITPRMLWRALRRKLQLLLTLCVSPVLKALPKQHHCWWVTEVAVVIRRFDRQERNELYINYIYFFHLE